MGRISLGLSALFLIALSGCIPSLHPLYLPENLTAVKAIEGKWVTDGTQETTETWEFLQRDSLGYTLNYSENDQSGRFDARPLMLGTYLFIDVKPNPPDSDNDVYQGLMLPLHLFGRVWIQGDSLRIAWLDGDYVKDQVDKGDAGVTIDDMDEDQILTSSTQELQAFVLRHVDDSDAFYPVRLVRAQQ